MEWHSVRETIFTSDNNFWSQLFNICLTSIMNICIQKWMEMSDHSHVKPVFIFLLTSLKGQQGMSLDLCMVLPNSKNTTDAVYGWVEIWFCWRLWVSRYPNHTLGRDLMGLRMAAGQESKIPHNWNNEQPGAVKYKILKNTSQSVGEIGRGRIQRWL